MNYCVTVLPSQQNITVPVGENLLTVLRNAGLAPAAPCGGNGTCGKCKVIVNGRKLSACKTQVNRNMTVTLPGATPWNLLTEDRLPSHTLSGTQEGYLLAFDVGTTTVAGYLLAGNTGEEIASQSRPNPQSAFGADVVSRIRHALQGQLEALTAQIRSCLNDITASLCQAVKIGPGEIRIVSLVGNPAMQQLFLGISPKNLSQIPFSPILTQAKAVPAKPYLPLCENAQLLIVPNISGFVGADTVACVLASQMDAQDPITLLVDIGTNGEMVLGNRHRMVACSTAAGPALEGANIHCGMTAQTGAIDHVRLMNGQMHCSVLGNSTAKGICGSGLIDAVSAALEAELLNTRGRIQNDTKTISLTEQVFLTQEDIRQIQMAKSAIAAGISLMADHLGIPLTQIDRVYLAGAFGTFLDPDSACRIGLLPSALQGRIRPIGNAAGRGAKLLACDSRALEQAQQLISRIEHLELASLPAFPRRFAENMRF